MDAPNSWLSAASATLTLVVERIDMIAPTTTTIATDQVRRSKPASPSTRRPTAAESRPLTAAR